MVKTLERTASKPIISNGRIFVDPSSEDKMLLLQKALREGKVFILGKTAMKKNMGFACEKDIVTQMYLFRELVEEYAKTNGLRINIFEKYEDDAFAYEAQLIIKKETNNI